MTRDTAQQPIPDANEISLAEYNSRIADIHHRIKNNLQVIISLFSLQADRTTDPNIIAIITEMQNRVRAMAFLHEPRYSTEDFSTVHFGEYLHSFVRELHASYAVAPRVQVELALADLALGAADAMPLALICNELVSNACKHAFPGDRCGKVSIALRYASGTHNPESFCELQILDDGVGLPEGTDVMTAESLGFHMVRALTLQLQGAVETHSGEQGTSFVVTFPLVRQ